MSGRIEVDGERLVDLLADVNKFGATPAGGAERLAWTKDEVDARAWLLDRCRRAGFESEQDEAGNVWAFGGTRPAVVMGSHLDTVPNGGRLDGALGVVAALEVMIAAREAGLPGGEQLGLVCFADEEGVRFNTGMTGSRALAGTLDPEEVFWAVDSSGQRLCDILTEQGLDPARVTEAAARRSTVAAYLELHIEQGRRLEEHGIPVAAVDGIAGLSSSSFHVTGQANHAGTTRLSDRRDALLAVAAAVTEARRMMRTYPGLVATVGAASVTDGASNIIPGRARCTLDVRSISAVEIDAAVEQIVRSTRAVASDNHCGVDIEEVKRLDPVPLDPMVTAAITTATAAHTGREAPVLASMAGHDAMNLAAAGVPTGMVFVRSQAGMSHCPQEHSSPADCTTGAQCLAEAAMAFADDRRP